ncbi:MAG: helix-turn-helix domain-containing protein [Bacteroidota bacterium]
MEKLNASEVLNKSKIESTVNQPTYLDKKWVIFGLITVTTIVLSVLILFQFNGRSKKETSERLSRLTEEESDRIENTLASVIQENKPFLNPNLSLTELAKIINTTDKNLSHFLNHHLEMSFYDYLNKLRIDEFLRQINGEEYKNYSLIGVALECGFKSKSSFYRAFKKEKSKSPREFIDSGNTNS